MTRLLSLSLRLLQIHTTHAQLPSLREIRETRLQNNSGESEGYLS